MSIAALLTVAWIYATPCTVAHPPEIACRQYAVHLAAERALIAQMQDDAEFGGDSDVGCVNDCLEPQKEER